MKQCLFIFVLLCGICASAIETEVVHIGPWLATQTKVSQPKFRVLLLPGLLETDVVYEDILQSLELSSARAQLIAADPSGFKGQAAPEGFDYSVESYARELIALNHEQHFDVVVGHSFFANVLIEVLKTSEAPAKVLLLSPSLRRDAESFSSRALDRISRVSGLGAAAWSATYLFMPSVIGEGTERRDRVKRLASEARLTPKDVSQKLMISFFDYLDRNFDLTHVIADSTSHVWFGFSVDDVVEVRPGEMNFMAKNPRVQIFEFGGSGHMSMVDNPRGVSELIAQLLALP